MKNKVIAVLALLLGDLGLPSASVPGQPGQLFSCVMGGRDHEQEEGFRFFALPQKPLNSIINIPSRILRDP